MNRISTDESLQEPAGMLLQLRIGVCRCTFLGPDIQIGREAFNIQQILTRWRRFSPKEDGMVAKVLMAAYSAYYSMKIHWLLTCFDFVPWLLFLSVQTQQHSSEHNPVPRCICTLFFFFFFPFLPLAYAERESEHPGAGNQRIRDYKSLLWWTIAQEKACAKDVSYCYSVCNLKKVESHLLWSVKDSAYKIQFTPLVPPLLQKDWKLCPLLNTMHFFLLRLVLFITYLVRV